MRSLEEPIPKFVRDKEVMTDTVVAISAPKKFIDTVWLIKIVKIN